MGIRTVSRSIHEKMIRIPAHNVRKCHGAGLIIDLSCKIIVKSVSRLILSLFSMFLSVLTFAQGGLSTDFEKLVYKRDGNSLPYRLLKPEQPEPGKKYPLIVFLHGAGERGTDNEVHIDHVTGLFLNPHNRKKFPCYVLAPQCPKNVMWASHDREGNMKSSQLFFNVFHDYEAHNLLLRQAYEEVMDFQLEEARLRNALERINHQKIVIAYPDKPTPFAFPIIVDRLREKLTSEKLEDRIKKMALQYSDE